MPKPYQPSRQAPVNELERSRLWRAHYPDAESFVLHDLGCVKPVIKLLKVCEINIFANIMFFFVDTASMLYVGSKRY